MFGMCYDRFEGKMYFFFVEKILIVSYLKQKNWYDHQFCKRSLSAILCMRETVRVAKIVENLIVEKLECHSPFRSHVVHVYGECHSETNFDDQINSISSTRRTPLQHFANQNAEISFKFTRVKYYDSLWTYLSQKCSVSISIIVARY